MPPICISSSIRCLQHAFPLIVGEISMSGATYKAMEFVGTTIKSLSDDNVQHGHRSRKENGIVAADRTTYKYLEIELPHSTLAPFHYPVNLVVSKIAPALIAENSIMLKPPTQGAVFVLHMVHCFHLAGCLKKA
ncbi:hypothetical protein RIF29_18780 [Crotalaria pallida]|uniref:NADP-dependent glyceraldehyde-3-phosphate dehydrogenase n=1 Tax=Crotalaria pallida TaxID=3830 RepID=A0AAN9I746_CROPI